MVENVLSKKCVLPVHVRAVKKPVSIHDVVPEPLANVVRVVISFRFYIVLVRWNVLLFRRACNSDCSSRFFLYFDFAIKICCLESTELLIEVDKDVCATYLHQTFISCNCKYNVLFVNMGEHLLS